MKTALLVHVLQQRCDGQLEWTAL